MDIKQNPIYLDFDLIDHMVDALIEDRDPPGLLLYGPPGIGKTFGVRRVYKKRMGRDVQPMDGSARGILDYIFEHADDVLVFDDTDRMFFDPQLMSLFKKLIDTNEPRIITHRVKGENALPPFRVTAAVIIITNLDFDNPKNFGTKFFQQYVRPFCSRLSSQTFKITDSPSAVFEYTLHLAPEILRTVSLLKRATGAIHKLTSDQRDEVLDHFRAHYRSYPEISPRMIYLLGKARLNIPDDRIWVRYREKILDDVRRDRERRNVELDRLKREAERGAERLERSSGTEPAAARTSLLPIVPKPPHLRH